MDFTVYDPKGEMFEVPAYLARHLIVDLGWTFHPPGKPVSPFKSNLSNHIKRREEV